MNLDQQIHHHYEVYVLSTEARMGILMEDIDYSITFGLAISYKTFIAVSYFFEGSQKKEAIMTEDAIKPRFQIYLFGFFATIRINRKTTSKE